MTEHAFSIPELRGDSLAIMLYGSQARGNPRPDSDVDILQLVETSPYSYSLDSVNVAQYRPTTIRRMAQTGSLFVNHLRVEGIILKDLFGVLKSCLDEYVALDDLNPLLDDIGLAAKALASPFSEDANLVGLCRLGIYLLRTTLYIQAAQKDFESFDLNAIFGELRIGRSTQMALSLRNLQSSDFNSEHVNQLRAELSYYLKLHIENEYGSIEGLALAQARNTRVAPLLENILMNHETVDYSALTLPPF